MREYAYGTLRFLAALVRTLDRWIGFACGTVEGAWTVAGGVWILLGGWAVLESWKKGALDLPGMLLVGGVAGGLGALIATPFLLVLLFATEHLLLKPLAVMLNVLEPWKYTGKAGQTLGSRVV